MGPLEYNVLMNVCTFIKLQASSGLIRAKTTKKIKIKLLPEPKAKGHKVGL